MNAELMALRRILKVKRNHRYLMQDAPNSDFYKDVIFSRSIENSASPRLSELEFCMDQLAQSEAKIKGDPESKFGA